MSNRTWSEQQKAIFEWFAHGVGNLLVRARAGTGKTTTIIAAVAFAVADKILLCAFNKRIQQELQKRLPAGQVEAKTLHALGFAFIRRLWNKVTVDAAVDQERAQAACGLQAPDGIVTLTKKLAGLLKGCAPFAGFERAKEIAEDFDCLPGDEWAQVGWTDDDVINAAIKARDAAKVRDPQGRISFDDMVYIPLALNLARPWFTLVVVDEAQDMSYSQLLLAQRACKKGGRIVVVGDDRQAIYGFRGADAGALDRLKSELKAAELGLTVTYRCPKKVVAEVAALVPDFTAHESAAEGTVDEIAYGDLLVTAKPGSFVLSRKNAPLLSVCLGLLRAGVPARIEGRDIAEALRQIVKKLKARTVPEFIKKVAAWQEKKMGRLTDEQKEGGKGDAIKDQAETLVAIAEGCASVAEIDARLNSLFADSEGKAPKNCVVCSSVHKAKGLEAERVFILRSTVSMKGIEEQNIYYVAATRSQSHLTWVNN